MSKALKEMYERHHREERGQGFSILERERGELFRSLIGKGKMVVDIGCRDGALSRYFSKGNSVLGVDVDEVSLKRARESLGIETMPMDLNGNWKELGNRKFDVVVAGETLEHLFYPERISERVANILNPSGVFLGSVPNAFSLKNRIRLLLAKKKNTPLNDPTHINHFSYYELKKILEKHFSNVEVRGMGRYRGLASFAPNFFAFDLVFIAKK